MIELAGGEQDAQNLSFHTRLLEAMAIVLDKFPGIVEKAPFDHSGWRVASAFQAEGPRAVFAETMGRRTYAAST